MRFIKALSLLMLSGSAYAQPWSTFIDPTRAIDWSSAGFTIPSYSVNCSTQPTLTASSTGAASSNGTAIQNALASCDATHNVVNIPAGTYYTTGIAFPFGGKRIIRGAGPASTTLIPTTEAGCAGGNTQSGICMRSNNWNYNGSASVLPPSGTSQCLWTGTNGSSGTYTQGATTINLTSCGGAPVVNHLIILDQKDDSTDTNGVYICDSTATNCNYDGSGSLEGRVIGGVSYSQTQVVYATAVTSLGGGAYNLTVSPGVYFNNVRTSQSPGAWWSDIVQNNGIENLTLDASYQVSSTYQISDSSLTMFDCYQCWAKNIRFLYGGRASVLFYQSLQDVVRDCYFYQAQGHAQVSYNIESHQSSGFLIENNIFQQVTTPMLFNTGTGSVTSYNFSIDNTAFATYAWAAYSSHDAGNNMNLFEGNNFMGIVADDAWGSSAVSTYFRNMLIGWQTGATNSTVSVVLRSFVRAFNVIGNVMGQPSYHNQYQTYATSNSAGTGAGSENTSIYSLGWGLTGPVCGGGTGNTDPTCDAKVFSTLMRWGNYDIVNAGIRWDSTEASPGAVTYVSANFSSGYFGSLAHTLPSSLYYSSQPFWWPGSKAWPPIGPDISTGNVGTCSGTYSGAQGTSSSQCIGGSLSSAWASHVISLPAQDCFLTTMGGHPDGTGSVLAFDASTCYAQSASGGSISTGLVTRSGAVTTH